MAYTIVERIAKVRVLCHKVLPAVYDESLSYLEQLAKLAYKLNETIDGVNALNENVTVLNDSVTDLNERVEAVEGEISGFEAEVTERVNQLEIMLTEKIDNSVIEMEQKVDTKLETVDVKIDEIERRVDELDAYVHNTIDDITRDVMILVNTEIQRIQTMYASFEDDMKQYVEDKVNEVIAQIPDLTNIYVVSPASGNLVKVQVALDEVFDFHLYNALTVDEYNSLGLTVNELNALPVHYVKRGFTVREWLHDAKRLLIDLVPVEKVVNWVDPHSIVRNTLTGALDWLEKNIDINTSMWMCSGCFTAGELATLDFTCDEIIDFNMTCDDYVMRANEIMVRTT